MFHAGFSPQTIGHSRNIACALRVCAVLVLAAWLLGLNSQGAWGRDAFDADYTDCPAAGRLPAVAGLTVTRQDDADKIRIAWRPFGPDQIAALGDTLPYRTRMTFIVEGRGHDPITESASLGANELIVDNQPLTAQLTVSAALTDGSHVMSHIATTTFGSSMAAPHFYTPFYTASGLLANTALLTDASIPRVTGVAESAKGRFYYLGFGPAFRNHALIGETVFFRVGLAHGGAVDKDDLDRVDFAHYRLRVERENEGDVAGFDAVTVTTDVYKTQVLHAHAVRAPGDLRDLNLASLRVAARAGATVPALSTLRAVFPVDRHTPPHHHVAPAHHAVTPDPRVTQWGLTDEAAWHVDDGLFAPGPHVYYDFPGSLFTEEGAYTLTAWAEDDAGARLSPERSVTVRLSSVTPSVAGIEPFVTLDLWEGWTDDDDDYQRQAKKEEPEPTPCESGSALSNAQKRNVGLVRDCNTLLAIRDTLDNTGGSYLNWATDRAIGSWSGITVCVVGGSGNTGCRGTPQRVTRIVLASTTSLGTFPPRLSELSALWGIFITYTSLSGPIPPEFGRMTRLTDLELTSNQLSGSIPPELGRLPRLDGLWLDENRLSGSIPSTLGSWHEAARADPGRNGFLALTNNNPGFTGCIPTGLTTTGTDVATLNLPAC